MVNFLLYLAQIIDPEKIGIPQVDADDTTVTRILQYVFVLIGAISVLIIFIAGIRYMISTGDPQKTATAKNTIIYAAVGLVISVSSLAIIQFIVGKL